MNETPNFMRNLINEIRAGNNSLQAAVGKSAYESSGELKKDKIILDRPKTPSLEEMYIYRQASVWLSKFFHPVWIAITEEKSDKEVIKLWIATSKKMTPQDVDWRNEQRKERKDRKTTYFIKARSLSKKHDWNTVK